MRAEGILIHISIIYTTKGTKMNVAVKFFTLELYFWRSHALILTGFFMHF